MKYLGRYQIENNLHLVDWLEKKGYKFHRDFVFMWYYKYYEVWLLVVMRYKKYDRYLLFYVRGIMDIVELEDEVLTSKDKRPEKYDKGH